MNRYRILGLIVTVFLLAAGLAGCSKSDVFEPTEDSLYVKDDGTVVEALFTTLDKDYYDSSELKSFIEEAVIEYNTGKTGQAYAYETEEMTLPVSILSYMAEGSSVSLQIKYQSAGDYDEFNVGEGLVTGFSVSSAGMADFTANLVKAKDGSPVDIETVKKNTKYKVVECSGEVKIQVQGRVMYMTENVTLLDNNLVSVSAADDIAYIVFR